MKKLLSLLLALSLVLSMASMALADDGVNETDYFDDQWHDTDVDLQSFTPPTVDEEANRAAIDAFYALFESEGTEMSDVETAFEGIVKFYEDAATNYQYYYYLYSADVTDEDAYSLYAYYGSLLNEYWDQVLLAGKEILNSEYAKFLEEQLVEEDIDFLKDYERKTQEEFDLDDELLSVEGEYYDAWYYGDPTFEYEGAEWTYQTVLAAYEAGEIDDETYAILYDLYYEAFMADVAAVYAHLQDVCKRIAEHYGYDNYAEYAYEEVYARDYTIEEMQAYCEAVKEYISPLVPYLNALTSMVGYADDESFYNVYRGDFTTEETLDAIEPYIGKISSEMLESWTYMREHNLIDLAASDTKSGASFTYSLLSSRAPYMIITPQLYIGDFSTIIHEFGHYNDNYWHEHDWNSAESNTDVAEVHSQANELLFSQYYEDFFGDTKYGVDIAMNSLMDSTIVWGLVMGALIGELELYIHSDAQPTLDDITAKFVELAEEYHATDIFAGSETWWIDVHHIVSQPLYYISYSVSAIGAFEFWLDAQENGYEKAYSDYLRFVALDPILEFKEMFGEMGMRSPFDADFIKDLGETLNEKLDLETRGGFSQLVLDRSEILTDVTYNRPERGIDYDEIWAAVDAGLMCGYDDGTFRPAQSITRAEAVYLFWEISGMTESETAATLADAQGHWYENAVAWAQENELVTGIKTGEDTLSFLGGNALSKIQVATLLYKYAELLGIGTEVTDELDAADAGSVKGWGAVPVEWCIENGIMSVGEDGVINPDEPVTRSKMAVYIVAFMDLIPAEAE